MLKMSRTRSRHNRRNQGRIDDNQPIPQFFSILATRDSIWHEGAIYTTKFAKYSRLPLFAENFCGRIYPGDGQGARRNLSVRVG